VGDGDVAIGLDFAFSFPRWWCERNGWQTAREAWTAAGALGEDWLAACETPFWGRPGVTNPHAPSEAYRRTDREMPVGSPKSVFQIGGAGAVGTGSIRGMPHLLKLADAGFSVWPFDVPTRRVVVEIYPRVLTGPVNKGRWSDRRDYLLRRYPDQQPAMLERAAGSEDAFDAAVSALAMSDHVDALASLAPADQRDYAIEGRIWAP
jgi:hypothetical protein